MTKRILLLASHAVAEYDDLRMLSDLGYDVFAPGGYENPSTSGEGLRPALPDAPHHPEFVELCNREREVHGEPGAAIDWAKAHIAGDIIDWADAIIVHHFPEQWIAAQWNRISHKRVIWRTCGQSNPDLEEYLGQFRPHLQVVRYSPAERRYFEPLRKFAGIDALIRFGKYPDDYGPWNPGGNPAIGNVTQHMKHRGDSTGYRFWMAATEGLPARPAGPGSEELPGGVGALGYYDMLDYLSSLRAYLYTGTTPASYTLGLMEAMLSGVPTLSIGANDWNGPADLFEGPEITQFWAEGPFAATITLRSLLEDKDKAAHIGGLMRQRAIDLFDVAKVGAQWREFLGG